MARSQCCIFCMLHSKSAKLYGKANHQRKENWYTGFGSALDWVWRSQRKCLCKSKNLHLRRVNHLKCLLKVHRSTVGARWHHWSQDNLQHASGVSVRVILHLDHLEKELKLLSLNLLATSYYLASNLSKSWVRSSVGETSTILCSSK